jgi:hypothetical protein
VSKTQEEQGRRNYLNSAESKTIKGVMREMANGTAKNL